MTVLHIFPYSFRCPGGHSNAIREYITCQRNAGLDSWGLSPISHEKFPNAPETSPYLVETTFEVANQVFEEIAQRFGTKGVILHLHAINSLTTSLARMARSQGMKVVMTSHGQLNASGILHFVKKVVYLALFPSPVRYAHGIHVLTRRERNRLRFLLPWFRGKVGVLPHVVGLPAPSSVPRSWSREPGEERIMLHLGRLDVRTKGLDLLVSAFALANLSGARLILAGPDWNQGKQQLESLATRLGCRTRVDFPGAVYGDDKERLLASADLFVATSRWDAFNLSVAEAMARGIPTLVSDRLNLAPELEAAGAATVVACRKDKIAAALVAAMENPKQLSQIGSAGRAWVEANTSSTCVGAGFAVLYSSML